MSTIAFHGTIITAIIINCLLCTKLMPCQEDICFHFAGFPLHKLCQATAEIMFIHPHFLFGPSGDHAFAISFMKTQICYILILS